MSIHGPGKAKLTRTQTRVTEPRLNKAERAIVEIIHESGQQPGKVDRWTPLRSDLTRKGRMLVIEKLLERHALERHPGMMELYRVNLNGWTTNRPGNPRSSPVLAQIEGTKE